MTEILMGLGAFRFSIATAAYQSLERQTAYRWASQERVGRAPALQFVGPGADTIRLPGIIYPHFRGGLGQLPAMRDLAAKGEPLVMVSGLGAVMGRWVIEQVTENQRALISDGRPLRVDFVLDLSAYGDDA